MPEKINTQKYLDNILEETKKLLAIDSPSGFTEKAASYVMNEYAALGYTPVRTTKGGVYCEISRDSNKRDSLMMEAHMDTLGAMVCEVQSNGYLKLSPIGGMNANNAEGENCKIYTRDGKFIQEHFNCVTRRFM